MCLYLQRRVRAWSHLLRIPHFRCFRQIANRLCRDQIRGVLKIEPWVTPWLTVNGLDLELFICTNCCLSVWQLSNQDRAYEETSRVLSLANRILCWVLSNVLLRSSIEMPVTFFFVNCTLQVTGKKETKCFSGMMLFIATLVDGHPVV